MLSKVFLAHFVTHSATDSDQDRCKCWVAAGPQWIRSVAALQEKLVVVEQYKEKVDIIDKFCNELKSFDGNLKTVDAWMMGATKELEEIKNASDKMAPEDRVARTMDLQEDIAAKVIIIKANIETELALLPQGKLFGWRIIIEHLYLFHRWEGPSRCPGT